MLKRLYILLLYSLLALECLQAQALLPPTLFLKTLQKEQGLMSGKVRNIMQDSQGFVYLCSTAGIERFDGYSLSHFRLPGHPEWSALMDQETRACLQDRQGRFWIATDFNGLFEYEPATGQAKRHLHETGSDLFLIDMVLSKKTDELWLATNKGLARLRLSDGQVQFYLQEEFFLSVFEDKDGIIWAGTYHSSSIHSLDPTTGKIRSWRHSGKPNGSVFPGQYCRSIAQDANGDLLFASTNGFFRMNPQSGSVSGYFHDPSKPFSYPGGSVSHLFLDHRGQLWVGTFGQGLLLFDRKTESFFPYRRKAGTLGSIAGDQVECISEDVFGQVWVGDHVRGVSYFNGNAGFIQNLQPVTDGAAGRINCLLDSGSELWMGLQSGLAKYDSRHGKLTAFPFTKTPFAANHEITRLVRLPSGNLLAGTSSGLLQFNPLTGQYAPFLPGGKSLPLSVLSMMMEGDSALWVSTTDAKLWRIAMSGSNIRRFEEEKKFPLRLECNTMFQTKSGRLCFGSYSGFCEYVPVQDTFLSNQVPEYFREQSNAVSSIGEDAQGILWIGRYGGGLDAFDPKTRRYRHFGTDDGLPDMYCISIQPDGQGRLWVGTENGLFVFSPPKDIFDAAFEPAFKTFSTTEGLPSGQASCSASLWQNDWASSAVRLYFGSEDGLAEVRPELLEWNTRPPTPALTAFRLFNRPLIPGTDSILRLPLELTRQIILPPKQNFFSLEFSALNLLSPEQNRYRYLLEGYDPDWVEAGVRHFANYTNVPPGSYTFRLEASNSDGVSSASPLLMKIRIMPPWHQTWWFWSLVVLAAVAAVYAYFRWRLMQLRKMEAMRQSIAADLHDEVGASLTSIQILAQLANHADPTRRSEALDKLPDQVRRTSASLREIVWNINPKHDALPLLLGELSRYAGEVFEKMDIPYTIHADDFPENAALDVAARQHLIRIFKETLNNLTKHSQASRAAVFFKKEGNELVVLVRDNGRGFDPATVHRGNGLENMQARAKAAKGHFYMVSKPGGGTETTLRLPMKRRRRWGKF